MHGLQKWCRVLWRKIQRKVHMYFLLFLSLPSFHPSSSSFFLRSPSLLLPLSSLSFPPPSLPPLPSPSLSLPPSLTTSLTYFSLPPPSLPPPSHSPLPPSPSLPPSISYSLLRLLIHDFHVFHDGDVWYVALGTRQRTLWTLKGVRTLTRLPALFQAFVAECVATESEEAWLILTRGRVRAVTRGTAQHCWRYTYMYIQEKS